MHNLLRVLTVASALCAAAAVPSAHGQLLLTGSSSGEFRDPGLAYTTVTNGPVVSVFESGIPYRPKKPYFDTSTSVTFTGLNFTDVGDGDTFDLGLLKIVNGVTLLGTTAKTATMDLYLNLPSNGVSSFKLTTLLFGIDSTANNGASNIPDLFLIGHTEVNTLAVGGRSVNFDLQFTRPEFSMGSGAAIGEGKSATEGLYATVHFTPVPEASTYALCGSMMLGGLVALRRFRSVRAAA